MTHLKHRATAMAGLALATSPFLLVATPAAADAGGKAAIEHAERQRDSTLTDSTLTKAQIEQQERTSGAGSDRSPGRDTNPVRPVNVPALPSDGGNAAAWQIALSAALGAALGGGTLVATRQMSRHRHAVAH